MNPVPRLQVGFKKILGIPADLGSQIVALPAVASRFASYCERVERDHAQNLPHLDARDAKIVETLRQKCVAITSLDELDLPESDLVLAEADKIRRQHTPLTRSFQCDGPDIMAHPALFRWGLTERLLAIAENYLGLPVAYDGLNIFLTKVDKREAGARRWHRDAEDLRMLKVALYIHDVDIGGGPLQVLTRRLPDHDRTVMGKFPILTQEKLEQAFEDFDAARDIMTCTGRRGTLIFADTASQFHRGMPAVTQDRTAIYFNYMHRVPQRPFRCERTPVSRANIRELVAPLPPRQRRAALWREDLPLVARLIPPSPIWK